MRLGTETPQETLPCRHAGLGRLGHSMGRGLLARIIHETA